MGSQLAQIVNNVIAQLKTIDGAGSGFTHDLSGSDDRVLIGTPDFPADPPRVYLMAVTLPGEHAASLGRFRRNFNLTFIGYTAAASSDAGENLLPAVELLHDIMTKLEADATLPAPGGGQGTGPALDSKIDGEAFDGSEAGTETMGTVLVSIDGFYNATTGA